MEKETWRRAVDLIERGVLNLDLLLTNRYCLEDWGAGVCQSEK